MDSSSQEENDNIDIYMNAFQSVNSNYNFLRISLFDLLNVYVSVHSYYIKYKNFLKYVQLEYNFLFDIVQNKKNVYTIDKKSSKKKYSNLPKDTYIIIGLKSYHKYKTIKHILSEVLKYDDKILNYLIYLQKHIITLINGMNKFNQFYCYGLKILFNYQFNDDNNIDLILLDNFNQLKQNYFMNPLAERTKSLDSNG